MTSSEYEDARRAFLGTGELDPSLLVLLQRTVARLIRYGGLPPHYSPTRHWDHDAEQEVLADWLAARLIGTGQLTAILHEAATPGSFMRIGELFLRRHLIGRLERSQATNLFARVRQLLEDDPELIVLVPATRDQDAGWGLAEWRHVGRPHWSGADRDLASAAWGLGEFTTIQYRNDARKLSPLLEHDELRRFVTGLLAALDATLTPADLTRALVLRFDLGSVVVDELDDEAATVPARDDVVGQVAAAELAVAVLAELTRRQVDVLRGWLANQPVREIASELRVAAGTVHSDQRAITATLRRVCDPDGASHAALLNGLRDALFMEGTHHD